MWQSREQVSPYPPPHQTVRYVKAALMLRYKAKLLSFKIFDTCGLHITNLGT